MRGARDRRDALKSVIVSQLTLCLSWELGGVSQVCCGLGRVFQILTSSPHGTHGGSGQVYLQWSFFRLCQASQSSLLGLCLAQPLLTHHNPAKEMLSCWVSRNDTMATLVPRHHGGEMMGVRELEGDSGGPSPLPRAALCANSSNP